jgi:hypothetical protein
MAEKSGGCLGCLGSLVVLTFFVSIVFGGGLVMRVGWFSFVMGKNPVDQNQIISNYFNNSENDKILSENAVKVFHAQMGKGQCKEIYNEASEVLKRSQSQEAMIKFCTALKQSLGEVESTQLTDWWMQPGGTDSDNYILLRFRTNFSKVPKSPVGETFIWQVKDGKPSIVSYEVIPPSMPGNSAI